MEELLKNIKIDDEISIILINKFSKINRIYSTNNRHKFAIMIKDRGQTIYYQNGKKYICDRFNVVFVPKGASYTYKIKESGFCYQINFNSSFKGNEIISIPVNDIDLINLFKKAHNNYLNNRDDNFIQLSIIYEIFSKLCNDKTKTNNIIKNALKFIDKNLSNCQLSNDFISKELNISEIYLRKLFKKHLNVSPHQYIIDTRLNKSLELLANQYSLNNIISIIGYSSVYSFSRAFKNKFGKSPLNHKKEI